MELKFNGKRVARERMRTMYISVDADEYIHKHPEGWSPKSVVDENGAHMKLSEDRTEYVMWFTSDQWDDMCRLIQILELTEIQVNIDLGADTEEGRFW